MIAANYTIFGRDYDQAFVSTWNTANTSAGSSTNTQVRLPLVASGTYNMLVDWGDGSTSTITVWNQAAVTHTYSSAGTYQIKITGVCRGWSFNNVGDRLKFMSVSSWGTLQLTTPTPSHFSNCTNLTLNAVEDVLDLSFTTSLQETFRNCTSLTTINRVNEWNVSNVINLSGVFWGATNFNQSLSGWNVSNVTNFSSMFRQSIFNQPLNTWNTGSAISFDSMFFDNSAFNQNVGSFNVTNVTDFTSMFRNTTSFNNGGSPDINNWTFTGTINRTFSSCFQDTKAFNQPLGNWDMTRAISVNSMFRGASVFNQDLSSWSLANVNSLASLFYLATEFANAGVSLNTWNVSNITDTSSTFRNTKYNSPLDTWNVSNVTNMVGMFQGSIFNQSLNSWNVANVTNMTAMFATNLNFNNGLGVGIAGTMTWTTTSLTTTVSMFSGAIAFNQNVGSFNMSNVTNASIMFNSCTRFNNGGSSDINNWNVSKCLNFTSILGGCNIFNQPLNNWTFSTTGSILMTTMFSASPMFNQDLGSWIMTRVTATNGMFKGCLAFNNGGSPDINNWDVSNVALMNSANNGMFENARAFNQPIGSWNVSAATSFTRMFLGATIFNQPLNNWNTLNVTDMSYMFASSGSPTLFNQNIGAWNTSNVITFRGMFNNARSFNNGGSNTINNWNTSKAIYMDIMFASAFDFNQPLGNWNVSFVEFFSDFMQNKTSANYIASNLDDIYNGWSTRPVKPNLAINFGTIKYTSAASAGKAILTGAPNNWTIVDGGL